MATIQGLLLPRIWSLSTSLSTVSLLRCLTSSLVFVCKIGGLVNTGIDCNEVRIRTISFKQSTTRHISFEGRLGCRSFHVCVVLVLLHLHLLLLLGDVLLVMLLGVKVGVSGSNLELLLILVVYLMQVLSWVWIDRALRLCVVELLVLVHADAWLLVWMKVFRNGHVWDPLWCANLTLHHLLLFAFWVEVLHIYHFLLGHVLHILRRIWVLHASF